MTQDSAIDDLVHRAAAGALLGAVHRPEPDHHGNALDQKTAPQQAVRQPEAIVEHEVHPATIHFCVTGAKLVGAGSYGLQFL